MSGEKLVRAVVAACKDYFTDHARWPDLADANEILAMLGSAQPTAYQELHSIAELRKRLDERRETAEAAISARDRAVEQQRMAEALARKAEAQRDAAHREVGKRDARVGLLEDALKAAGHGKLLARYDELAAAKEAAEQAGGENLDRAIKAENNAWEVAQDTHLGTIEGMQEALAERDRQLANAKQDIVSMETMFDVLDSDRHAAVAALFKTLSELRGSPSKPSKEDWEAAAKAGGVDWKEVPAGAAYMEMVYRLIEEQRNCAAVKDAKTTRDGSRLARKLAELQATIDRQKLALDGIASQCMCDGCESCEHRASNSYAIADACDRDAMLGDKTCRACMRAQRTAAPPTAVVYVQEGQSVAEAIAAAPDGAEVVLAPGKYGDGDDDEEADDTDEYHVEVQWTYRVTVEADNEEDAKEKALEEAIERNYAGGAPDTEDVEIVG